MHVFERAVNGPRDRIAAPSVWDAPRGRSVARQGVLGPAAPPPVADLGATRTVGTQAVGDVGARVGVAEQRELLAHIDRACGDLGARPGPAVGAVVGAVAMQRACRPGPTRELRDVLDASVPRISGLPGAAFSGQAVHRVAQHVPDRQRELAQGASAKAAVPRVGLSTDVLAFDTTNVDTPSATGTRRALARRGHAKSQRRDRRVGGLGRRVSERGHGPVLHRTYAGNGSAQAVRQPGLEGRGEWHAARDEGDGHRRSAQRTVVRDGGCWSPQLARALAGTGYGSLLSVPRGHGAAAQALPRAAGRGAMQPLSGTLRDVRAARRRAQGGEVDRTLGVGESPELRQGQQRGIAVALRTATVALRRRERLIATGRIPRGALEPRVHKALAREDLSRFVVTVIGGDDTAPPLRGRVDAAWRRRLEPTRLGRRVLCPDRHTWSTGRIVYAFRGQGNVEELFRRAQKGGRVPWGPSDQWSDGALRLHTFATVRGLTLGSLAKMALAPHASPRAMLRNLAAIRATLGRTTTGGAGRRPPVMRAPALTAEQRRAVKVFTLERGFPPLLSWMRARPAPA